MMKNYRTGIIGTGNISLMHALGYHYCERTQLVAVCDIHQEQIHRYLERAANLPPELQGSIEPDRLTTYSDMLEMVEKEKLDLVSVSTHVDSHCEIVLKLVEQGIVKGIICEKPIAVNLADGQRMVDACERAGIGLAIGHLRRFGPHFRKPLELIEAGAIGELTSIWATSPSGEDLLWMGTHTADLLLMYGGEVDWLMGQIGEILPERTGPGGYPLASPAMGLMRFRSGVLGVIENESGPHRFRFTGTEGEILFHERKPQQSVQLHNARTQGWAPVHIEAENTDWLAADGGGERYFGLCFDDLIACIESGGRPVSDGPNAVAALELLLSIYESARIRGRVKMPLKNTAYPLEQWSW